MHIGLDNKTSIRQNNKKTGDPKQDDKKAENPKKKLEWNKIIEKLQSQY